jgi:hypothetical protein
VTNSTWPVSRLSRTSESKSEPVKSNERRYHCADAAAVPDADPATLERPASVAAKIVEMIADDARAPSGARLVAGTWRAA